jgi:acyl CoA:acetate/3-ketoacid CoA transferase beta subunit
VLAELQPGVTLAEVHTNTEAQFES